MTIKKLGKKKADILQDSVPDPGLRQSEEPWYRSKRVQGIALFILSSVLRQNGWIDSELAGYGIMVGSAWAGIGFVNAQDRQTKIITATAKAQHIPVPPLRKG